MKTTIRQFMCGSIIIALVSGMAACNGTSSAEKKADDSATTVKAKKKKKGQTSVSGVVPDSAKMLKDKNGVYNRTEKAPEFPGGQAALADFINKNLTYPPSAIDNGTSGTVRVSFIVDEHGKVLDPQVADANRLGDGLADEALTVFNKMPLWTPGTVHGKKVKSRLQLPVTFELADADQQ